ncbi:MAG: hypothetical protein MI864_07805, partial [Pseudomonadales bacterium]|nr:hypothetical protein [Pseudomonadales bacterium]
MSDHQGIKIGFVLLSSQADVQPSTRISVFNILPYLTANNIEPVILYEPTKPTETPDVSQVLGKAMEHQVDVVYFQKVYGPSVEQLASDLREKGIKTIYGVCDVAKPSMAKLTDATVVVTNFLRTLYPAELQSKIHVVHDGIEHPEFYIKTYQKHCGSREKPLSAVLVTSATMDTLPMIQTIPEWLQVTIVGNYAEGSLLDRLRFHYWNITEKTNWPEKLAYIRFMLNRNITRVKWSPTRVYEELIRADLAIIPIAKYENDDEKFAAPAWKV